MAKSFENYYVDIDYRGEKDSSGNLKKYVDEGALEQSMKLWLASSTGEKLRRRNGGYLLKHLQKPMTEDRAKEIKTSIQSGIERDFQPRLQLLSVEVTPMFSQKKWKVQIVGYSPVLKKAIAVDQIINNLV